VDTQARHALKKDKFASATASSVSWVSGHRSGVLRWVIVGVVVLVLVVGAAGFWDARSTAADTALGAAMDIYDAPLATPGAPPEAGSYSTAADRAKAANALFLEVEKKYGWLPEGTKAHYFAGVTDQVLGQTASAEAELNKAAGAWDRNISNLAKLALAQIYEQTGRNSQAIDIYNQLTAKPSDTVTAGVAQLDLASLYSSANQQDKARAIWAKLKDSDKDGAAGSIAAQKLIGKGQ
jgi:tetratricopeptide (TPR) repeat protein